jgi:tyrosine-protein kinase Etk/Wzc
VAANLARTLALSGLRVALLDANLKLQRPQALFGSPGHPGILEFLRGEADARRIQQTTDLAGLQFVAVGQLKPGEEGSLPGARMKELLVHLRAQNDFVIIDGPPILLSDDASFLVHEVDLVTVVVRPFRTRARLLRQALAMLYQRRARQVNLVYNQARPDDLGAMHAMAKAYLVGRRNGKGRWRRAAVPPPRHDEPTVPRA